MTVSWETKIKVSLYSIDNRKNVVIIKQPRSNSQKHNF